MKDSLLSPDAKTINNLLKTARQLIKTSNLSLSEYKILTERTSADTKLLGSPCGYETFKLIIATQSKNIKLLLGFRYQSYTRLSKAEFKQSVLNELKRCLQQAKVTTSQSSEKHQAILKISITIVYCFFSLVKNDYQLLSPFIKSGSFGKIFLAREQKTGTMAVIKKSLLNTVSVRSDAIKEAHCREVKSSKNHAVHLSDFWHQRANIGYLVKRYSPGISLQEMINTNKLPTKFNDQLILAISLVIGLRKFHLLNQIHGDINPNNILIFNYCGILIDLGLCVEVGEFLSMFHSSAAPELLESKQRTAQFEQDIYSLGTVLSAVFIKPSMQIDSILAHMTHKDPQSRYCLQYILTIFCQQLAQEQFQGNINQALEIIYQYQRHINDETLLESYPNNFSLERCSEGYRLRYVIHKIQYASDDFDSQKWKIHRICAETFILKTSPDGSLQISSEQKPLAMIIPFRFYLDGMDHRINSEEQTSIANLSRNLLEMAALYVVKNRIADIKAMSPEALATDAIKNFNI